MTELPRSRHQSGDFGSVRTRPTRVTDETLLRARTNPTKFAAWVLRSMIDELIDLRLSTPDLEFVGWRSPKTGNLLRPGPASQKDWLGDGYEPVYRMRPTDA